MTLYYEIVKSLSNPLLNFLHFTFYFFIEGIENGKEGRCVKIPEVVDSVEALHKKYTAIREAQKEFASNSQEQIDKIFSEAAMAVNQQRIPLAKQAVAKTGMGVVEGKVIRNHYAAEYIYNAYRDVKTCGVIEEDDVFGIMKIAEPLGVIAAVIPTTTPTSTAIFKILLYLKTKNAIIISISFVKDQNYNCPPHPRAKAATVAAAKIVPGNQPFHGS